MASDDRQSRRHFMRKVLAGATLAPLATAGFAAGGGTAELPLLNPGDPEAKKVKYIEDATQEKSATKGNNCGTCSSVPLRFRFIIAPRFHPADGAPIQTSAHPGNA